MGTNFRRASITTDWHKNGRYWFSYFGDFMLFFRIYWHGYATTIPAHEHQKLAQAQEPQHKCGQATNFQKMLGEGCDSHDGNGIIYNYLVMALLQMNLQYVHAEMQLSVSSRDWFSICIVTDSLCYNLGLLSWQLNLTLMTNNFISWGLVLILSPGTHWFLLFRSWTCARMTEK